MTDQVQPVSTILVNVVKWLVDKEPQEIELLNDAKQLEVFLPEKQKSVVDPILTEALVILPKLKQLLPLAIELDAILHPQT